MSSTPKPQTFVFMGPQGSGKGTQVELLKKYLAETQASVPQWHVNTGDAFREIKKSGSYSSKRIAEVIDQGGILPVFLPIAVWGNAFLNEYTGKEHVFIDGFPRRVFEAQALDTAFKFYHQDNVHVIYLEVSVEESVQRLMKRSVTEGRADDTEEGIRERLRWYYEESMPVLDYLESTSGYQVHHIDGERTIEEIHNDIIDQLSLA